MRRETPYPPERGVSAALFAQSVRVFGRVAWRAFTRPPAGRRWPGLKRSAALVLFLPVFGGLQLVHWFALWLDELLYPGYRGVEVTQPVFIVGIPRSGTTFLHRVLSRDEERFTWFAMWELLFAPSIVERKVISAVAALDRAVGRPLERLLHWASGRAAGGMQDVHALALEAPEEDFLLLLPAMACYIVIAAFPDDPEMRDLAYVDERLTPDRKARMMAFYRDLVRRHLYVHGADKALLSKNVSFTPLLRALASTFPDGRFVVCTRDPVAAVPSQISAMEGPAHLFGNNTDAPEFARHWVDMLRYYYAHVRAVLAELPHDRAVLVDMVDLRRDLERTVRRIYGAFGFEVTSAFAAALAEEAEGGRRYRSKHAYALEDYGLDPQDIAADFGLLYAGGADPRDDTRHAAGGGG
jgi:hypothetical protein